MAGLPSSPFTRASRSTPVGPSLRDGLPAAHATPRGFTLTELLVAISIVLVLMGLLSAAVSRARGSMKRQATAAVIQRLDALIQDQFVRYDSMAVSPAVIPSSFTNKAAGRAWYVRRNLISGDLPDCWNDVRLMATGTLTAGQGQTFPVTAIQRAHVGYLQSLPQSPSDDFEDAECLFMIIMAGGIADCIDCGELRTAPRGDKDVDGAFEFWDEWGSPIRFVLWPAGLELPVPTRFFSGSRALDSADAASPRPGLGMRPLIFSAGPDGLGATAMNGGSNLDLGIDCGNPSNATVALFGGPDSSGVGRSDNITNFDDEAKR
jgi:prepilin-type N-terminal cleavage/methylation domain-containing protein